MQNTPSTEKGVMLYGHPGISGDYSQGMKKKKHLLLNRAGH